MRDASVKLIEGWSRDQFAANLIELAEMVKHSPRPQTGWSIGGCLRMMLDSRVGHEMSMRSLPALAPGAPGYPVFVRDTHCSVSHRLAVSSGQSGRLSQELGR